MTKLLRFMYIPTYEGPFSWINESMQNKFYMPLECNGSQLKDSYERAVVSVSR